jgi:hypothetical protein
LFSFCRFSLAGAAHTQTVWRYLEWGFTDDLLSNMEKRFYPQTVDITSVLKSERRSMGLHPAKLLFHSNLHSYSPNYLNIDRINIEGLDSLCLFYCILYVS